MAATTGTPYLRMFSKWACKLGSPARTAPGFSRARSPFFTPPLYLRARTVATTTMALGARPAARHLMSKNFSAPRSEPKPASVMQ